MKPLYDCYPNDQILVHHGIKGQKWGVRRYQNKDGSLTAEGRRRLDVVHDPLLSTKDNAEWQSEHEGRRVSEAEYARKLRGKNTLEAKLNKQAERDANRAKRQDYKQASKNRRNLSDEELLARIGRLEMEKKLKDLTDENLSNRSRQQSATKEVLVNAGKKIATTVIAGGAMYLGKACLTGELDPKQAASYLFPNPNKKK